jgi:hypothetical protein
MHSMLLAQELPKFIEERLAFCDSNISEDEVIQLREELSNLENYFVKKGLLADQSGASYRAVYQRVVDDGDLVFAIDTTFELLETLEFEVYTSCFYKVLTPEQRSQITTKHQASAECIVENTKGNVTPASVAAQILENFSNEDFELEYFKISALLSFYRIATPTPALFPEFNSVRIKSTENIHLFLNEDDQLMIGDVALTLKDADVAIYKFLSEDPKKRGIDFTASRRASYSSYLETNDMFDSVYSKLKRKYGEVPKNVFFNATE